jgi:hypothetical protein
VYRATFGFGTVSDYAFKVLNLSDFSQKKNFKPSIFEPARVTIDP